MTDAIKDPLNKMLIDDNEQQPIALISSVDSDSYILTPSKTRILAKIHAEDAEFLISDLLMSRSTPIASHPSFVFEVTDDSHWETYWQHFDHFLENHPQHNSARPFNAPEENALRLIAHQIICAELNILIDKKAGTNKSVLEKIEKTLTADHNKIDYYREAFKNAVLKQNQDQTIAIFKDELLKLQTSSSFVMTYAERKKILQLQKMVRDYAELYPTEVKQYEMALLQVNAIAIVANQSSKSYTNPIITAQAIERALSSNNRYKNIAVLIQTATQLNQLLGQDTPPLNIILQPAQWLSCYPRVLQKIAHAIERYIRKSCELELECETQEREKEAQADLEQAIESRIQQLVQQKLAIHSDYKNVIELYNQFKIINEQLDQYKQELLGVGLEQQLHIATLPQKDINVNTSSSVTTTDADENSDADQSSTIYHV